MAVILTVEQLECVMERAVTKALHDYDQSKYKKDSPDTVYNYNKTAKIMKKSFTTIKRMVIEGRITPVADGTGITRKEIDRYLNAL